MTPTEKRIIKILEGQACVSAKAIALELQWNDVSSVRKYLKRMQDKGLIKIIPQQIVPLSGQDNLN